jgi:hypothetical protein
VVLRFLALCKDQDLTNEIVGEAMWPVLEMMAQKDEKFDDAAGDGEDRPPAVHLPYHELLAALLLVVRVSPMGDPQPLAISGAIGWPTT